MKQNRTQLRHRCILSRRKLLRLSVGMAAAGMFTRPQSFALRAGQVRAMEQIPREFFDIWRESDQPVLQGVAQRTWTWGMFRGIPLLELYDEAPDSLRIVLYTDKARMEISNPDADPTSHWFVTNGLLVRELMTGQLQLGDQRFESRMPAVHGVAGDDPMVGPSYKALGSVMHMNPTEPGAFITAMIDQDGAVWNDLALAQMNVTAGTIVSETAHAIADVFLDFMSSRGFKYNFENGFYTDHLFADPVMVIGFPLTEAFWTEVPVLGVIQPVLVQAFERRVLTYTPAHPPGWQVEMGNVGLHYLRWRYDDSLPEGWWPTLPESGFPVKLAIGTSVEGRSIDAFRFGAGPDTIIVIGGIHTGEEAATTELVYEFIDYFATHPTRLPSSVNLILIPALNVDGLALGTRVNANGVDLNRNWPRFWKRWAFHGDEVVSAGAAPLSEPETAALYAMFQTMRPVAILSWHSQYLPSGMAEGNDIPVDDEGNSIGKELAQVFAHASGAEYVQEWNLYPITGQLIDAMEDLGVPAVDIELPGSDDIYWEQNLSGLMRVVEFVAGGQSKVWRR